MSLKECDEKTFFEVAKSKNIIVWGTSTMAKESIVYFELEDRILVLVDNDTNKQYTKMDVKGRLYDVISPTILNKYENKDNILLISSRFYLDIIEQLKDIKLNIDYYAYPMIRENTNNKFIKNLKNSCTGCFACASACPVKCIGMTEDENGFLKPKIDKAHCIECGLCKQVCKRKNGVKVISKEQRKVYAMWAKNDSIRRNTTSGGIASLLGEHIIKKGGYVCGVKYDKMLMPMHYITNTLKELELFRYSKYVQSDLGNTFREIENLLLANQEVMFIGTPCQVDGLQRYLNKEYENLLTVTFMCGGNNSRKVYREYLKMLERQYDSKVVSINFRKKSENWAKNGSYTEVTFENGCSYKAINDVYLFLFSTKNITVNESCYDCKYTKENHTADITLGDFWGIEKVDSELEIDDGVSVVMCNTEKGLETINCISPVTFKKEYTFENIGKNGDNGKRYSFRREEFFNNVEKGLQTFRNMYYNN